MFIHSIVYVVLAILTATAAYASSMPIKREPREMIAPELEREANDTLQQ